MNPNRCKPLPHATARHLGALHHQSYTKRHDWSHETHAGPCTDHQNLNQPAGVWSYLNFSFQLVLALLAGIQLRRQPLQRLCLVLSQVLLDGLTAVVELVGQIVHLPQRGFALRLTPSSGSPVSLSLTTCQIRCSVRQVISGDRQYHHQFNGNVLLEAGLAGCRMSNPRLHAPQPASHLHAPFYWPHPSCMTGCTPETTVQQSESTNCATLRRTRYRTVSQSRSNGAHHIVQTVVAERQQS